MMLHFILAANPDPASTGTNTTYLFTAILSSAVIVLGGLAALVRAIWKTANVLRDNTLATKNLTARFDDMASSVDGRFDRLSARVQELETREYGRHDGLFQPGTPGQRERTEHKGTH